MDQPTHNIIYHFGPYRVNGLRRQLLLDGKSLPITPKAFDTLVVLISRCSEIVSKDELMLAVWPDTAVEENNLIQQISYLRKLLQERAGDHNFIVTIPGRGYRFVAKVSQTQSLADPVQSFINPDAEAVGTWSTALFGRDRSRMIGYSWAMAFILAVCFPFLWADPHSPSLRGHPQSLAVLKFKSNSGRDEVIGDGISDTLRARLGSVQDLIVRPDPADDTYQDVIAAGRKLNVDTVLTGSVQRSDERIRVTVEMIDVRNGRVVWGEIFDNRPANLFELQDSIVGEVARFLDIRFATRVFDRSPERLAIFKGSDRSRPIREEVKNRGRRQRVERQLQVII